MTKPYDHTTVMQAATAMLAAPSQQARARAVIAIPVRIAAALARGDARLTFDEIESLTLAFIADVDAVMTWIEHRGGGSAGHA